MDRETAARWFRGALQFIEVAATTERPSVPSPPIDAAWHAFILHTRAYSSYCQQRYGRYIHHLPTPPDVKAAPDSWMDAWLDYAYTRLVAEQRFGELDPDVWPVA